MNEWTRRALLGAAIPAAVMALGLAPYLAYRSELPERVASHYSIAGRPDGSMTTEQFLIAVGVLVVLGWGACTFIALTRRRFQPMVAPTVSFVGAFLVALGSGILATTAIGQRGLDSWQDASLSPWALLPWLAGSLIVGSAAARIASSLPHQADSVGETAPPAMDLAPGERAFWTATMSAGWPMLMGSAVLVAAVVLAQLMESWIGPCDRPAAPRHRHHHLQPYPRDRRPVGTDRAIRVPRLAPHLGAPPSHRHRASHRCPPGGMGRLGIPGQPDPHEPRRGGPARRSRPPPRSARWEGVRRDRRRPRHPSSTAERRSRPPCNCQVTDGQRK